MNYRHAFHAGNFADVLKHAMLARILVYLTQKPAPLRYIDTHAGIGWYDLDGGEASRTGEWRNGIGRLAQGAIPDDIAVLLRPYLDAVGPCGPDGKPAHYPGSPAVAEFLLRSIDKMLLCELHPADAAALRSATKADKRVKVLVQDGYAALNAALPPPERRGLVLIDPPFEDKAEFDLLGDAIERAFRKWPTGTYLVWYPIKDGASVAAFGRRLGALALPSWLEIAIERDRDEAASTALRACGLFIINPPYTLRAEAERLVAFLAERFSQPGQPPWRGSVTGHER